MVGVIFFHSPVGVMKRAIRVERESMWDLKWSTCQSRSTLGHNIGSTYALFPIFFLTPFLWVLKFSVMKLTAWRLPAMDVAANTVRPQLKEVSLRQDGILSDLDDIYSTEWRRKK